MADIARTEPLTGTQWLLIPEEGLRAPEGTVMPLLKWSDHVARFANKYPVWPISGLSPKIVNAQTSARWAKPMTGSDLYKPATGRAGRGIVGLDCNRLGTQGCPSSTVLLAALFTPLHQPNVLVQVQGRIKWAAQLNVLGIFFALG